MATLLATMVFVTPGVSHAAPRLTITAVGTSLTHNAGWSEPLAAALRSCGLGPVQIVQIAEPGENSFWGVKQIEQIAESTPDVLLIEFSANDARLWGGTSLQDSRTNVLKIIEATRRVRPTVRVILMAMNPSLGVRGWIRPWLNTYYDTYRALSEAAGLGFVDHRPAWHNLGDAALSAAIPDGMHPTNEAAAAVIVPALVAEIAGFEC